MTRSRPRPVRVLTLNTPRKSYLWAPRRQVPAIAKILNRRKVDVAAFQEVASGGRAVWRSLGGWHVEPAPPNNVLRDGNEIGNLIVARRALWNVLDEAEIPLPFPEERRTLHLAARLVKRRSDGFRMTVIAVHFPTLRSSSKEVRDRMNRIVSEYAERIPGPVVIAGDFNDGDVRDNFPGFRVAAKDGIDQILVKGFKPERASIIRKVKGGITDHPSAVLAKLRPYRNPARARRLPKA